MDPSILLDPAAIARFVPALFPLVPRHMMEKAKARFREINPFAKDELGDSDLVRALRLAWIHSAKALNSSICALGELEPDGNRCRDLQSFSDLFLSKLDELRDRSFDRYTPLGTSAIDQLFEPTIAAASVGADGEIATEANRLLVSTIAALTDWRVEELPGVYQSLSIESEFGQQFIGEFHRIMRSPGVYPEASAEFDQAMVAAGNKLAIAMRDSLVGMDDKLDQVLERIGPLSGFDDFQRRAMDAASQAQGGINELLIVTKSIDEKFQSEMRELTDRLTNAIMNEANTAAEARVDRLTVIAIAEEIVPNRELSYSQALNELRKTVRLAKTFIDEGKDTTNRTAFVAQVLRRVSEQAEAGALDAVSETIDSALEELDRAQKNERERIAQEQLGEKSQLLEKSIAHGLIKRDQDRVVGAVISLVTLQEPERPLQSELFRTRLFAFLNTGDNPGERSRFELHCGLALVSRRLETLAAGSPEYFRSLLLRGEFCRQIGMEEVSPTNLRRAAKDLKEAAGGLRLHVGALTALGEALIELGTREEGEKTLHEAVDTIRLVSSMVAASSDIERRFRLSCSLADAYGRLYERTTSRQFVTKALAALVEAEGLSGDSVPYRVAVLLRRGLLFKAVGDYENSADALLDAERSFRVATKFADKLPAARASADIAANFAHVLFRLAEKLGSTAHATEAIDMARSSLAQYSEEKYPVSFAMSQQNLGGALSVRGELNSDPADLHAAIGAHLDSNRIRDRDSNPLAWATTTMNLGVARMILGRIQKDIECLKEAEVCFLDALAVFLRSSNLRDRFLIHSNLAKLYFEQSLLDYSIVRWNAAANHAREALKIAPAGSPSADRTTEMLNQIEALRRSTT